MTHTPPTDQQLAELETLAKNIPAGPWTVDDSHAELRGSHGNLLADLWDDRLGAYFAAMHAATLPLVAEVRRLQVQRKFLFGALARKDARGGDADRALREFLTAHPDETEMAASMARDGFGSAEIADMLSRPAAPAAAAAPTKETQPAEPEPTEWMGATELASDREIAARAASGLVGYRQDNGRLLHCLAHKPAPASRYADFHEVGGDDLDDGGICVHPRCGRDLLAAWPAAAGGVSGTNQ